MISFREYLNETSLTPEQKARAKSVVVRKSGGNDKYSWAMFVDDRVIWNGMSKSEATWRKNKYIKDGSPLKKKSLSESAMHKSILDGDFKKLGLEYLSAQSSGEVSGYWANPKGKGVSAQALHQLLKSKGWKLSQSGGSAGDKWNKYTSDKPTPYTETSVIFTYDGDKVKLVHHRQHLDRT